MKLFLATDLSEIQSPWRTYPERRSVAKPLNEHYRLTDNESEALGWKKHLRMSVDRVSSLTTLLKMPRIQNARNLGIEMKGQQRALMKILEAAKSLEELTLYGSFIGNGRLARIATISTLQTKLVQLNLGSTKVTDDGLVELEKFSNLERLLLHNNYDSITDAGMAHLAKLQGLKELHLSEAYVGDNGLAEIAKISGLEKLDLYANWHITDAGLEHLASLKGLKSLNISRTNTNVTEKGVATVVENCRALEELRIERIWITDNELEAISRLPKLKSLDMVMRETCTSQGLEHLTTCIKLETLSVGFPGQVTDEELAIIARIPNLKNLGLHGIKELTGTQRVMVARMAIDNPRLTISGYGIASSITLEDVLVARGTPNPAGDRGGAAPAVAPVRTPE